MIVQPDSSTGCGVACVAYTLGLDYGAALKIMADAGATNSATNHNVKVERLAAFLENLDNPIYVNQAQSLSEVQGIAFLYVKWPQNKRYRHWVVFIDGYYYDPGYRSPLQSYPVTPLKILALYDDPAFGKPLKARRDRKST